MNKLVDISALNRRRILGHTAAADRRLRRYRRHFTNYYLFCRCKNIPYGAI